MHYPETSCGIELKRGYNSKIYKDAIGQRKKLSRYDVLKIKFLYPINGPEYFTSSYPMKYIVLYDPKYAAKVENIYPYNIELNVSK